MVITIIPFPNPGSSERNKWLDVSRAKSHASRISHSKRVQPAKHSRWVNVSLQRSDDWCFGRPTSILEKFNSLDVDLLQSCIRCTPEAIMNGHMIRSPAMASVVRMMTFPVLKDLFQRCAGDADLFVSALPVAAVLVIRDPRQRLPLKSMVEAYQGQALRSVRRALDAANTPISIHSRLEMMHLCIRAFVAGELKATEAHLRGLLALRPVYDFTDPLESLIWYVARNCAVGHAIQTSQPPVYQLDNHITNDQWVIGYGRFQESSATPLVNQHGKSKNVNMGRRKGERECLEVQVIEPDLSMHGTVSRPTTSRASRMKDVMPAWKAARLVSETAEECVRVYKFAVSRYPNLAHSEYEVAKGLNLMYNQRLAALHQLCSAFFDVSSDGSGRVGNGVFDNSVIVALQIHLVADLGGLLSTMMDTLRERLYAHLRLSFSERPDHADQSPYEQRVERQQCEVWLLLTGLLATSTTSNLYEWFREEVLLRIRALRAWAPSDLCLLCSPFGMRQEILSPAFLKCAMALGEAGSWTPEGTTLPSAVTCE